MDTPLIGSRISLISKNEIRYEGILYDVNKQDTTIALKDVRCFGTEHRQADKVVPPNDQTYDFIKFRGIDLKDIHLHTSEDAANAAMQPPPQMRPPPPTQPPIQLYSYAAAAAAADAPPASTAATDAALLQPGAKQSPTAATATATAAAATAASIPEIDDLNELTFGSGMEPAPSFMAPAAPPVPQQTQPPTNDSSMPPPSASPIPIGTRVELHGLKAKPQLNGQYGIVVGYVASSSRCSVALEGAPGKTETKMNIKPENLTWNQSNPASMSFIPEDLYDIISGDLMEDPVIASDGHSYSRQSITGWINFQQQNRRQLTSPLTRKPMLPTLRENLTLKKVIQEYRDRQAAQERAQELPAQGNPGGGGSLSATPAATDVGSLNKLGLVYQHLDRIREVLAASLDGWQPPQLVAVGNEKAGKSTLLERLCMMPIFPHAEEICTRMKIQVRLRRTEKAQTPTLEVYNLRSRRSESRRIVPMDGARMDVRSAMDELIRRQNQRVTGVSSNHMIILHINSPNVPTLDLLDLPGVVTAATSDEPADMPTKTQALVKECIEESKKHSIFLCTVPLDMAPNSSTAVQLLTQEKVLDRTVGVLTMCDEAGKRHQLKLRDRLNQKGDGVVFHPYGWVATMNAPVDAPGSNYAKLVKQAEAEVQYFRGVQMEDMMQAKKATTGALIEKVNGIFLKYLETSWLPNTIQKLNHEQEKIAESDKKLGLPVVAGNISKQELASLHKKATEVMTTALKSNIEWMHNYFGRKVIEPLSNSIKSIVSAEPHAGLGEITALLEEMALKARQACTEAQEQFQGIFSQMAEAVLLNAEEAPAHSAAAALQESRHFREAGVCHNGGVGVYHNGVDGAPTTSETAIKETFQIGRFPDAVLLMKEHIDAQVAPRMATMAAQIEMCIACHFQIPSPTIHVTYATDFVWVSEFFRTKSSSRYASNINDDLESYKSSSSADMFRGQRMRPELVVDIARIQADFVHIFAENGGAILNEAVGWQSQVRRIVNVAISSETVEACHAERLALKQKSQWVAEAIAGLQPIFGVVACTGVGGIPGAFIGQRVQRANGRRKTKRYVH